MDPKVCIITATINRISLGVACRSINAQTYHSWHHYVIGDGVLPDYLYHPQRSSIGFSAQLGRTEPALNMPDGTPNPILRWGINHLNLYDYVCFLDDDNEYNSNFLEKMVSALEQNQNSGIVLCGVENLRGNWRDIDGFPEYRRCDNSGCMARSPFARLIGYPPATKDRECVQDYEFIKTIADRFGWCRVPEKLVRFGSSPNTPPLRGGVRIVDSWALPIQGFELAKIHQYERAITLFNNSVQIDPLDAWAWWHLGEVHLMVEQRELSLSCWTKWKSLIDTYGTFPDAWTEYCYVLACHALGTKDIDTHLSNVITALECEEPVEQALILENYIELGFAFLFSGDIASAKEYFTKSIGMKEFFQVHDILWNLEVLIQVKPDLRKQIAIVISILNSQTI